MITMIAAIGAGNELGKDNDLLWEIPTDMKFFRDTTKEHTIVMGRRTFESFGGRMLPRRHHVILTRGSGEGLPEKAEIMHSVDEVLKKYGNCEEEIFIIGGSHIYSAFYPFADKMYLTHIKKNFPEADVFFPDINENEWNISVIKEIDENGYQADVTKYVRKA